MSNANSQNQDCQGAVCETSFKPSKPAGQTKQTFENIKSLAGELLGKVKET